MTWAYLYFMTNEAARVREVAPQHAQYWHQTGLAKRGGPFSDRSGGLIIFEAADEGGSREDGRRRPVPARGAARAMVAEGLGAGRRPALTTES
jgi:hypothetical protein